MAESLIPILLCIAIAMTFGAILLCVAHLLSTKAGLARKVKGLPYECGLEGEENTHSRVSVQFYLTAILFIIFDIEIIFLYPWALSFNDFIVQGKGLQALIVMGVFLGVFVYGLIWEVLSKSLSWKSS